VGSRSDGPPEGSKNPEHCPDHQEDGSDRVKDSDIQEHAQQEQDYARNNHVTSFQGSPHSFPAEAVFKPWAAT
jgi:hypothetical protein